jgi:hypothetical protein
VQAIKHNQTIISNREHHPAKKTSEATMRLMMNGD